jgi:hypothetical protein
MSYAGLRISKAINLNVPSNHEEKENTCRPLSTCVLQAMIAKVTVCEIQKIVERYRLPSQKKLP